MVLKVKWFIEAYGEVSREPLWYNGEIVPSVASYVPEVCSKHNIKTMLKVYGVEELILYFLDAILLNQE